MNRLHNRNAAIPSIAMLLKLIDLANPPQKKKKKLATFRGDASVHPLPPLPPSNCRHKTKEAPRHRIFLLGPGLLR